MTIPWNFTGCYSLEEWKIIIADWEKSGLSRHAYCKLKKIPYHSFYRWHNKIYSAHSLSHGEIRERWKQILKNWEESGLSLTDYGKAKGLSCNMLYLREKELNPHTLRPTSHMKAVEKWTPIVEDWKKSGLNRFAYCNKYGISYTPLSKWITNLTSPDIPQAQTAPKEHSSIKCSLQESKDSTALNSILLKESSSSNQRVEIFLSHGESFCLEGPFDWPKLMTWLTPLLTR